MNSQDTIRTQSSQKNPAELELEIDQRRRNIEQIVGALEQKLTPRELLGNAVESGKDRGRQMVGSVTESIRANPMPALLTAAGVTWLLASRDRERPLVVATERRSSALPALLTAAGVAWLVKEARSPKTTTYTVDSTLLVSPTGEALSITEIDELEEPGIREKVGSALHDAADTVSTKARSAADTVSARAGDLKDSAGNTLHSLKSGASNAMDTVKTKAGNAMDSVKSTAGNAMDTVKSTASSAVDTVKSKAGSAADAVKTTYVRASDGVVRTYDEHPLAMGLAAVAAGALLGALLPSTRKENELMGEKSDELARRAKDMAREKLQDVKATAREVASTSADVLESSGLMGGESQEGSTGDQSSQGSSASGADRTGSVTVTETTVSRTVPGNQRPH